LTHAKLCAEQSMQVWPLLPHAWSESPAWHVAFWQHPVQFDELHPAATVHALLVHTFDDVVQFVHAAPPLPHAVFEVPATHVVPEQHPFGHVDALHGGGAAHAWFVHTSFEVAQFWHALPPDPHAVLEVPMTQTLPEQQPDAHVDGLHSTALMQRPPEHMPLPQFWQAAPICPHAAWVVPAMQTPPEQHPAQFAGEQACEMQTPAPQSEPGGQTWHTTPPCPHSVLEVPATHAPFEQQPAGHVDGSHVVLPVLLVELVVPVELAVFDEDACDAKGPPPPFALPLVELAACDAPP
jgi:hypothetical protein